MQPGYSHTTIEYAPSPYPNVEPTGITILPHFVVPESGPDVGEDQQEVRTVAL